MYTYEDNIMRPTKQWLKKVERGGGIRGERTYSKYPIHICGIFAAKSPFAISES
jgi:hypothetical protein